MTVWSVPGATYPATSTPPASICCSFWSISCTRLLASNPASDAEERLRLVERVVVAGEADRRVVVTGEDEQPGDAVLLGGQAGELGPRRRGIERAPQRADGGVDDRHVGIGAGAVGERGDRGVRQHVVGLAGDERHGHAAGALAGDEQLGGVREHRRQPVQRGAGVDGALVVDRDVVGVLRRLVRRGRRRRCSRARRRSTSRRPGCGGRRGRAARPGAATGRPRRRSSSCRRRCRGGTCRR